MPEEYTNLVTALKGLTQGAAPDLQYFLIRHFQPRMIRIFALCKISYFIHQIHA